MIHLKPGDILSLVTATGADVAVHMSWRDSKYPTGSPGRVNKSITTATTTTLLEGPAGGGPSGSREITYMSIRNVDSTTQTVTLKHNDGTTNVEIFKTELAAGSQATYDPGAGWVTTSGSLSEEVLLTATTDTANSATDTLANVTGLTYAVDAGDTYYFRAVVIYTADATTSGSRTTINGPAASAGTSYHSRYSLTTTSETVNSGLTAVQLPAAANATSAATAGNIAIVEGIYIPSTAGTLAVQQAAEAGTITALAGSTLRVRKLINV